MSQIIIYQPVHQIDIRKHKFYFRHLMNRECQIVRRYQNFYPTEFVKYQGHPSVIVEEDSNENAIEHFESNIQTFLI